MDLVGADVLRDTTGFACGDFGLANGVEERGLAVIDVSHDGDDGSARGALDIHIVALLDGFEEFGLGLLRHLLLEADDVGVGTECARDLVG